MLEVLTNPLKQIYLLPIGYLGLNKKLSPFNLSHFPHTFVLESRNTQHPYNMS